MIIKNLKFFGGLLSLVFFELYLLNARNDWYVAFNYALYNRKSIFYEVLQFVFVALLFFIVNLFFAYLKVFYIEKERNDMAFDQYSLIDFSQQIEQDMRLKAENFVDFFVKMLKAFGIMFVFFPKLYFLLDSSFFYILLIFTINVLFSWGINYLFIRPVFNLSYNEFLEKESDFRKFLSIWFQKKCLNPIEFDNSKMNKAILAMKKYFYVKSVTENFRVFYDSVGLIVPFVIFYSFYINSKFDLPILMQLINLWTQLNYSITMFEEAYQAYLTYLTSSNRLIVKKKKEKIFIGTNLSLQDVTIEVKEKKLFKKYNFVLKQGQKINLIAPNKTGKTTLMKTMQGYQEFLGKITLPENILWIPEHVVWPEKITNNDKFVKNCEFMKVDSNLCFEQASGSEKWKLIASYAMLFETVVWDDPFWGLLNVESELQKILEKIPTILIFSQNHIENFENINL